MSEHDRIPEDTELLLPWYATGRLSDEEKARVEAWLEAHPEARRQLELIDEELATTISANEAASSPRPGAIDYLMEQVAAEPRRSRAVVQGLIARLGVWLDGLTPQTRGALVAASLVLVIAQAAVIGVIGGRAPATYETASGAGPALEAEVLVSFSPDATIGEIATLLGALGASVVDGPKPGGVFALAIAAGRDPQEVVDQLAARDDVVSFAALGSTK